jgi:hypothetical protein
MTASIAAEISKDVRVMRFLFPGWIGPRPLLIRRTCANGAPGSNANNTTKLRQLAALLTTW